MRTSCVLLAACLICLGACAKDTAVRHYQMVGQPITAASSPSPLTLGVDYFSSHAAYEDVRIVYRKTPYRLDYYDYHRWSAPPSVMVTDAMVEAFQESKQFKAVHLGFSSGVDLLLKGRLMALEEVDHSDSEWTARLVLDLHVLDPLSNEVIWSSVVRREQAISERTPEGVVIGLSEALKAIVLEIGPKIAQAPRRSQRRSPPASPEQDASGGF